MRKLTHLYKKLFKFKSLKLLLSDIRLILRSLSVLLPSFIGHGARTAPSSTKQNPSKNPLNLNSI